MVNTAGNTAENAVDRNALARTIGGTGFPAANQWLNLTETADKILKAVRCGSAFCAATTAKSRPKTAGDPYGFRGKGRATALSQTRQTLYELRLQSGKPQKSGSEEVHGTQKHG